MRKKALKEKVAAQKIIIKNSSPQTYASKRRELEKWVTKEKNEIRKLKYDYDTAYRQTQKIIQENRLNKDFIKKMLRKKRHYDDAWSDMDSLVSFNSNSFVLDKSNISLDHH